MKKVFLSFLFVLCISSTYAQQISMIGKDEMKEILWLHKNTIEGKVSYVEEVIDGNSLFYLMKRKDGNTLAILDNNKNLLLQFGKNGANLIYVPERKESFDWRKGNMGINDKKLWPIRASKAVFIASDMVNGGVYGIDGSTIIKFDSHTMITFLPDNDEKNPLYIHAMIVGPTFDPNDTKEAVYTIDGKEIVPPGKYKITTLDEYKSSDKVPYHLVRFFQTERKDDGVCYYGAYPLTIDDAQKYGYVPTEYTYLRIEHAGALKVQRSPVDPVHEYVKDTGYVAKDRDEGEHYYKLGDFDRVIEYYSHYKDVKPWAVFYSGMALYQKAEQIKHKIEMAHFVIYDRPDLRVYGQIDDFKKGPSDIMIMKDIFAQSFYFLDYYLNSGDTEFINKDSEMYHSVSRSLSDTNTEEYQKIFKKYNDVIAWLKKEEMEERERIRQQQAIFWGSVLNAFADGLCNAISASTSQRESASFNSPATKTHSSGVVSSSTHASSSPSSSQSDSSTKPLYESMGSISCIAIYSSSSRKSTSIDLYKNTQTGKIFAKIGGKYIIIHRNELFTFLDYDVASYRYAVTGSCTYFFNL